jgi:hypothetical protein
MALIASNARWHSGDQTNVTPHRESRTKGAKINTMVNTYRNDLLFTTQMNDDPHYVGGNWGLHKCLGWVKSYILRGNVEPQTENSCMPNSHFAGLALNPAARNLSSTILYVHMFFESFAIYETIIQVYNTTFSYQVC